MGVREEVAILHRCRTDLVVDVGANIGQTGVAFRNNGYNGRILSFEPIQQCFDKLSDCARNDALWSVENYALGAEEGLAPLGISKNLVSSSLLSVNDTFVAIEESIGFTHQDMVQVVRLDSVLSSYLEMGQVVHLKIDTQGFERAVLEGASGVLDAITTLRLEASVRPVYQGETKMTVLIDFVEHLSFDLIEVWPAWRHPETGDTLQFDLMFRRRGP